MSLPSRASEAEARKQDIAFQIALAQIGVGTLEDALALWDEMDPTSSANAARDWLDQAVYFILTRRRLSRDLAMAYYRLARALRTGKTIRDPFGPPEPEYVTIGMLRRQFDLLLEDIGSAFGPGGDGEPTAPETLAEDAEEPDAPADPSEDDSDRVDLEELDDLDKIELENERVSEESLREELEELGLRMFELRRDQIDDEETRGEGRSAEDELRTAAGMRTARVAGKVAMNGGRGSAFQYGSIDSRVIAWARVSKSGDPCYFCAMLISRGAVYKTEASASFDGSGDLYHDDCQCMAVPIYSTSQYETDERFDQNRILSALWKQGTSLKEWRKFIDERRRTGNAPWVRPPLDTPAQEAGSPNNDTAQEA